MRLIGHEVLPRVAMSSMSRHTLRVMVGILGLPFSAPLTSCRAACTAGSWNWAFTSGLASSCFRAASTSGFKAGCCRNVHTTHTSCLVETRKGQVGRGYATPRASVRRCVVSPAAKCPKSPAHRGFEPPQKQVWCAMRYQHKVHSGSDGGYHASCLNVLPAGHKCDLAYNQSPSCCSCLSGGCEGMMLPAVYCRVIHTCWSAPACCGCCCGLSLSAASRRITAPPTSAPWMKLKLLSPGTLTLPVYMQQRHREGHRGFPAE